MDFDAPPPPPLQRATRMVHTLSVQEIERQLRTNGVSRRNVENLYADISALSGPDRVHLANRLKSDLIIPADVSQMIDGQKKKPRSKRAKRSKKGVSRRRRSRR